MSSTFLPAVDPTLLEGVRAELVDCFSRATFDAIPDVSALLEGEGAGRNLPADQRSLARASQVLTERRGDLRPQISSCMRRNFDAKILPLLIVPGTRAALSLDALTLLADERLDEEIAVNQCTRRLKEQCEYELWGLTQRFCNLTGRDAFTAGDNPVFPQLFAKSLMDALVVLELPPAGKLAVFKAFGPPLLDIVAAAYRAANAYLTARGVDVDVAGYYGSPVTRTDRTIAAQPATQEMALGVTNSNAALLTTLKNLIERSSSHHPVYVDASKGAATPSPPQLVSTLQLPAIQHALDEAGSVPSGTRSRALHVVRQSLHHKLNADEQVITDIVIVMFDRLSVESRIAPQLQAVIRRLQLPVLELALKDRSLLTQVQHPVRKLIDLIAEFGLTLELDVGDQSTILSVANIVDGLLYIHDHEPRAFQLAFERLDDLFYHHEEAALQRNESVRKLEKSEGLAFAGRLADREIAIRLQNRTLPPSVTAFIITVWRDVLVNGYIKDGPKGKAWKLGLTTLDSLLKSLSPATSKSERAQLAAQLPPLIALLQKAPYNTHQDPSVMKNFHAELTRIHTLALADDWAAIAGPRFVPAENALSAGDISISPSAELALLGMACGDWVETRDARGRRRWRLNWITSILGTCVFKHYESNTTRNMSIDDLRASLASGETQRVRGLGLADEVINDAFEVVSRMARRAEAAMPAIYAQNLRRGMKH